MMEEVVCPSCSDSYKRIANHWGNTCPYPEFTDYQFNLLVGTLMGDASVNMQGTNPLVEINSTNIKFLQWVSKELGVLSTDVRLKERRDDRRDYYRVTTRSHPDLQELYNWYDTGKKRFPDNLQLTPTVAKMWYVTDGGIEWQQQKYAYSYISSVNESDRSGFLLSLFDIPATYSSESIRFNSNTDQFLSWIGGPVPGFGYKWETDSFERYKLLKNQSYNVDGEPNDDYRG